MTLSSSAGLCQMQQEAGKPQEFAWTSFNSLPVESDKALNISRAGDRYSTVTQSRDGPRVLCSLQTTLRWCCYFSPTDEVQN